VSYDVRPQEVDHTEFLEVFKELAEELDPIKAALAHITEVETALAHITEKVNDLSVGAPQKDGTITGGSSNSQALAELSEIDAILTSLLSKINTFLLGKGFLLVSPMAIIFAWQTVV
jgi:hypothetical protein